MGLSGLLHIGAAARSREEQLQFLRQSARLEEYAASYFIRGVAILLSGLLIGFILWSMFAEIEEISQAPGEVVPNGFTRVVQHYDGGIVKEILVQEGSNVKKGDILLRLDGAGAKEELNKALIAYEGLEHALATVSELFTIQQHLQKKGVSSRIRYLQARQAKDQAKNELNQQKEVISRLKDRVDRLKISAPVAGIIKGIKVNTIGEVIKPGEPLMEIMPTGEVLVVEAHIASNDIGYITVGQPVKIKVSSFDYGRFGVVDGVLDFITATTFDGANGEKYYRGRISLKQNYVGTHKELKILPGMTVQAGIVTGRKSVMAYLLKPVQRALKDALSER